LSHDRSVTIVMTESDPEAVASFADRLVVLQQPALALTQSRPSPGEARGEAEGAEIVLEGTPRELFRQAERLAQLGVAVPQMAQVAAELNTRLGTDFDFLTVEEGREALVVHFG
jgi:ABC-type cobalamin/Fe3+-siderophores transport system ATPase subunit